MEIKPKESMDDWKIIVGNYDEFFSKYNIHIWVKLSPTDFETFINNANDVGLRKWFDTISNYAVSKYKDLLSVDVKVKSIQIMCP